MGVYIKDMAMPKSCLECPFKIDGDDGGICPYVGNYCADYESDRHKDCPLVPVPPHGDLIDRDAATEKIWDDMRFPSNLANAQFFVNELREMPTIISVDPPKEGEG